MNSSPQNTNSAGGQRRTTTGVDNSDEEEWSGVVECVIISYSLSTLFNRFIRSNRGEDVEESASRDRFVICDFLNCYLQIFPACRLRYLGEVA